MKKILVPTDFSPCAAKALHYAFDLANFLQAEVVLFHAMSPNEGVDNNIYNALFIEDYYKIKEEKLREMLNEYTSQPAYANVAVSSHYGIGSTVSCVLQAKEDFAADLIVMGTTGASGIKELFLGSIANKVISNSNIPVLAVPMEGTFHEMGKTFVFALDFENSIDPSSLDLLKQLAKQAQAQILFLHAVKKEDVDIDNNEQEAHWSSLFSDVPHEFNYIQDDQPAHAINEFIQKTNASFLCLVSHRYNIIDRLFYKSITEQLAYHSHIPLLVLQEKH